MTPHPVDGHWLDFYAVLDVPANADEDAIRKRIGKVYSEAAANSDHRDLARRHYFQALLERVLPQCRRVLLDPAWRAKYDEQYRLNAQGDPKAQNYIDFVTSMRGQKRGAAGEGDEMLPQRVQDDINLAREVVECAWQGAQLDLLPSHAVSHQHADSTSQSVVSSVAEASPAQSATKNQAQSTAPAPQAVNKTPAVAPVVAGEPVVVQHHAVVVDPVFATPAVQTASAPVARQNPAPGVPQAAPSSFVEEIVQDGAALHAKVITSEAAAAIRRKRGVSGVGGTVGGTVARPVGRSAPGSRVLVGDDSAARNRRLLSPTSLNLMVGIVGVMLTMTIHHFSQNPAVANNQARTRILVSAAPEMESVLLRAETAWEQSSEGAGFDLVVQSAGSKDGMGQALSAKTTPDAWIPSDASWVERYNRLAAQRKRPTIAGERPLAQSPMVLIARSERAAELRRLFPRHQVTSWQALRGAVARGAAGHLGLSDPQKTESGALARLSMAREWGANNGMSASAAAKNPQFWQWMAGFENNSPSASARTADMIKDMAQNTTGRFWWVIAYESDALQWMNAGKKLEIFYLPRTTYANHPFCSIERVGASDTVAAGRASFEKFLRSQDTQKVLLNHGFRPTEINLKSKTGNNPFLNASFRARGARTEGLPLEERTNATATEIVAQQWEKRYG